MLLLSPSFVALVFWLLLFLGGPALNSALSPPVQVAPQLPQMSESILTNFRHPGQRVGCGDGLAIKVFHFGPGNKGR